jgi:hypothetical protein
MGWRTTLGLTLAALTVAGCLGSEPSPSPSPGPVSWQTRIASLQEGTKAVVTLVDSIGLVTAIGQGDRLLAGLSSQWVTVAVSPDADAPGLAVVLTGSVCDEGFDLALRPVGAYVLLSRAPTREADCDAMAVGYELAIELSEPIEASRLVVQDGEEDEGRDRRGSWGFVVPGSDGISRSVKVLDVRGDLVLAMPLVPAALPDLSDDVGLQRPLGRVDQILLAWAAQDCHEEMIVTAFPSRAAALEVALHDTDASGCDGPSHLQGLALTFRPGVDTAGIDAVVVENR